VRPLKRSSNIKGLLERGVMALSGITSVTASSITGNALVHFDQSLGLEHILAHIEGLLRGTILAPDEDTPGGRPELAFHFRSVQHLARELGTSAVEGLTREQARERLRTVGRNLIASRRPRSGLAILLGQFGSPPVALLALAAVVSVATGGVIEALSIVFVVGLNGLIGFVTESRAQRMIQNLGLSGQGAARVIRQSALETVAIEREIGRAHV
jgi:P-type Ca2+ transporter type 2C